MSEVKVNKISPRTNCGTVQLGDSGDTITIPAGASISNSGTASGFGSTGEVSWVTTKKTATFTVTAGEGYFCDTSGGAFTVNLPAGTAGNSFAVADYTNTFQTNNLTISPNGSQKIGGVAADATLSTEGQSAYFVYVDDTEGWKNVIDSTSNLTGATFMSATGGTVSCSGNFKIHTFTGPGTFCVSSVSNLAANNVVDYLVVAGGGSGPATGGGDGVAGGGGAGGFRFFASPSNNPQSGPGSPLNAPAGITVSAQGYPITVGGGGDAGTAPGTGNSGSDSVFSTITSAGGGKGGRGDPSKNAADGGSGGGGANNAGAAGSGNTPSVSPAQGTNGGAGGPAAGGGGGGAIAAGAAASSNGGNGGAGGGITGFGSSNGQCSSCVQYFSGGGGGGNGNANFPSPGTVGTGGLGGGADGRNPSNPALSNGTVNTGGGGGGASDKNPGGGSGGNGGSGIVVIRYQYQ